MTWEYRRSFLQAYCRVSPYKVVANDLCQGRIVLFGSNYVGDQTDRLKYIEEAAEGSRFDVVIADRMLKS